MLQDLTSLLPSSLSSRKTIQTTSSMHSAATVDHHTKKRDSLRGKTSAEEDAPSHKPILRDHFSITPGKADRPDPWPLRNALSHRVSAFLPRAIRSRRAGSPTFIDKPNAVSDRARLHARRGSLPNLHMCVDEPRSSVARVRARAHESSAPSGHSAQSTSAAMASSIAAGLLEKQFTFYRCSVSIVAIPSAGEFVAILFLSEKIFF